MSTCRTAEGAAAQTAAYIEAHLPRFERELCDFLRIPSVSLEEREGQGSGTHQRQGSDSHRPMGSEALPPIRRAAAWLREAISAIGFDRVEVIETAGHPIVLASRHCGDRLPTILVYGHYDVQPAGDEAPWGSPPFEPTRRGGRLYARGAVDDKGQVHMHLKALETLVAVDGRLPVNVKLLIEGEEEVGSVSLERYIAGHAGDLACDAVVISDSEMLDRHTPCIETAFRGIAVFDLRVRGPARDLHSGLYGGAVANPANGLARILAGLVEDAGRITLPFFYEKIRPLSDEEIANLRAVPFDEAAFLEQAGTSASHGERGFSALERVCCRPSLDVHGLSAGARKGAAQTVVPSTAEARLSIRLVCDQDPEQVAAQFQERVAALAPAGVETEVSLVTSARPWRSDPSGPLYRAAARAMTQVFERAPVFARGGGSLPIVPMFEEVLGAPVLLLGFGLPGSNPHGPDEWLDLAIYRRGIEALTLLYRRLGDELGPADSRQALGPGPEEEKEDAAAEIEEEANER